MTADKNLFIQNARRTMLRSFLAILLLIGILLSAAISLIYHLERRDSLAALNRDAQHHLELQETLLGNSFAGIFADLFILAQQNELLSYLETGDPRALAAMGQEYLAFSRQKVLYDQVRFLDEQGMEICRANYHQGRPALVASEELQSKRHRYYFRDTLRLQRGEVFISPFDLNIEQGRIEQPLKPVVRFGTPVFDRAGRKRGVIVLNYLGQTLLDTIQEVADHAPGKTMLLNRAGYWLMGGSPADEWAFMYDDRQDRSFATSYPAVWNRVQTAGADSIETPHGTFNVREIAPLASDRAAADHPWRLVGLISTDWQRTATAGLRFKLFWMGLLLLLLATLPAYLLAQAIFKRKLYRLELLQLANYDKLTGLPNRTLFLDRLEQLRQQAWRANSYFALLFIDLDGFKAVNDELGHDAGDELLVEVARRLADRVRTSDTVARLGGDEFTVILSLLRQPTDASRLAESLIGQLEEPFAIKGRPVQISASIGISIFPHDGSTSETLLTKADRAMYLVKNSGKNGYQFFSPPSDTGLWKNAAAN